MQSNLAEVIPLERTAGALLVNWMDMPAALGDAAGGSLALLVLDSTEGAFTADDTSRFGSTGGTRSPSDRC